MFKKNMMEVWITKLGLGGREGLLQSVVLGVDLVINHVVRDFICPACSIGIWKVLTLGNWDMQLNVRGLI